MNKNEIFTIIQEYLSNTPLMLIGTGVSIPVGIPGMCDLSDILKKELSDKYATTTEWNSVVQKLDDGNGLEAALTGVRIPDEIINDIRRVTWETISKDDLDLFKKEVIRGKEFSLSKIITRYLNAHPCNLEIITTNYDRYIEYCCDLCNVDVDNRYIGKYLLRKNPREVGKKNIVNLYKVHGSLDTFFSEETKSSVCIPLQSSIPPGLIPDIITPGSNKYETLLSSSVFHGMLNEADAAIRDAKCFLCIGYGFNDNQIQQMILDKTRRGTPIVVVTQSLSDASLGLINSNCSKSVVIIEEPNKDTEQTRFIINRNDIVIDGNYWNLDGFIETI